MRDAPIQPGERRTLQRPADRDPLVMQLQRDGHGHERERGAGDERETPEVAFAGRLDAQELPQQDGQHRARARSAPRRSPSRSRRPRAPRARRRSTSRSR